MPPKFAVSLLSSAAIVSAAPSAGLAQAGGGSVSSPVQVSLRILPLSDSQAAQPDTPMREVPVRLLAGTPILLRIVNQLPSASEGTVVTQRFLMEVVSPVTIGGIEAIPARSPAEGELIPGGQDEQVRLARANWLLLNDHPIRLSGTFDYARQASGKIAQQAVQAIIAQDTTLTVRVPVGPG